MTQGNRKPEGGVSALRVRISRMLDRTNIEQTTAKRNAEHFEISRTPHIWLDALSATNLPSSAFRIAIRLAQTFLNKGNGFCYPSIETLARVCDLPLRTARDGLDALRAKGFIITQKIGTHDPLFFFFAVPSRVAEIRHSEESVPRVENSHSRVSNFRRATNVESSTGNHREEPERGTIEDTGVPCRPPSAVVAEEAPPVDLPATPPDLPRTAPVSSDGQPSDFHPGKEEREDDNEMLDFAAFTYRQRSEIVRGVIGKDHAFQFPQVMDAWEDAGQMSRHQLRALSSGRRSA